jgi:hypothetical protein
VSGQPLPLHRPWPAGASRSLGSGKARLSALLSAVMRMEAGPPLKRSNVPVRSPEAADIAPDYAECLLCLTSLTRTMELRQVPIRHNPLLGIRSVWGLHLTGPTAIACGWGGAASQHVVQSSPEVRSSGDPRRSVIPNSG